MYSVFGEERIKSGEKLEVGVIAAPDAEFSTAIAGLLIHKDATWQKHMEAALQGRTGPLETRFHVGRIDGVPVANVMTVEYLGVGILGHVFTSPEHRRKGICNTIMRHVMESFQARGGKTLLLGTGYEAPPYWIYHSFGFRSIKGGFMRYDGVDAGQFETTWFAPGPAAAVPLEWRHWPLVGLLGAQTGGVYLRSALWRLYGAANLETPVVRLIVAESERTGANGAVLESATGAVVGCATVHPTGSGVNGWPGVWLLDAFAHPNFQSQMSDVLGALSWPAGKVIAYADTSDQARASAFEAHGLEREGTLRDFLRFDGASRDAWLYGKTIK